jgi:hypothetical protein
MLKQLILSSMIMVLTIAVQASFISMAMVALKRMAPWFNKRPHLPRTIIALSGVALWLMAAHSINVWLWAGTFFRNDVFSTLEEALYFSVVSFTTLGFGDVLLPQEWRLLAGLCAANGLLIFGLSTAFLVEFYSRLMRLQKGLNETLLGR